jgi:fructose-1,6-bisphosphatase I
MATVPWAKVRTLESTIGKEQRLHPHSRGIFSDLMRRIGVASKVVVANVKRAALLNQSIGMTGPRADEPLQMHLVANDIMKSALVWMPSVAGLASREEKGVVQLPEKDRATDQYIVFYDPIDGRSNVEANGSVGTIFSIYRCISGYSTAKYEDFLQPPYKQAAAGYVLYGSSTMLVVTTGQGVHGFTLDPEIGEFVLSHENILIPDKIKCFSANSFHMPCWDEPSQRFAALLAEGKEPRYAKTTSRYIGSLVADFHRNLLYGGVFMYPTNQATGENKLLLMYECGPLAMIIEQAGGLATTGRERILDIRPTDMQQTVPLVVGPRREVELYEKMVRDFDVSSGTRRPSLPPPPAE